MSEPAPERTPPDDTILEEASEQLMEEYAENGGGKPYYEEIVADVLRIAEKRVRAMLAHYPEDVFPPDGTTTDAISAKAMRHAYTVAADMLGEGLPDE